MPSETTGNKMRYPILTIVGIALFLLCLPSPAPAFSYSFVRIPQEKCHPIIGSALTSAMNDEGVVGFVASDGQLVCSSDGIVVSKTLMNPPYKIGPSPIAIANDGFVFVNAFLDGVALLKVKDGNISTFIDSSGILHSIGFPAVNGTGSLAAFAGNLDDGTIGAFRTDGLTITRMDAGVGIGVNNFVEINEDGTVAFFSFLGGSHHALISNGPNGLVTVADDFSGPFTFIHDHFSINSSGVVAFRANRADGSSGIFTWDHGVIQTVAETSTFLDFGFPCIDDSGRTVFSAKTPEGKHGMFDGPNAQTNRLFGEGDVLLGGRSKFELFSLQRGCNESGQIAFAAFFDQQSEPGTLFRADPCPVDGCPQPVPAAEPSVVLMSLLLFLICALSLRLRSAPRRYRLPE